MNGKQCLDAGADLVLLGRAAILHHDFPLRAQVEPDFKAAATPVTREYLQSEGLGEAFVDYMASWSGFVSD